MWKVPLQLKQSLSLSFNFYNSQTVYYLQVQKCLQIRSILNPSIKYYIKKKFYWLANLLTFLLLAYLLMPSDRHKLRAAKATGLISSLISVALSRDDQLQQLKCFHLGATFMPNSYL